jgi:steroid delta-isomerase-like uncharacterized protein
VRAVSYGTVSAADNVATLRRLVAAMNQDELARVAPDVYAPGFVRHDLAGTQPGVRGAAGVINFIATARAGLPDVQYEIDDIFGAGDRVAMRFTMRGTHRGDVLGHPPTGRRVAMSGMNIYRLEDGKIAESWQLFDIPGLIRQIEARDVSTT